MTRPSGRAASMLAEGFRDAAHGAEPALEHGLWFFECEDRWRRSNDALLAVDIPGDLLRPEWQSELDPNESLIPSCCFQELGAACQAALNPPGQTK